jgi:hypothetical protein
MTTEELAFRDRQLARSQAAFPGTPLSWYGRCSAPKCPRPAAFKSFYEYVGRGGQVRATRDLCPVHADQFSAKHGLALDRLREKDKGGGE